MVRSGNLQDIFLNQARKDKVPLTIFLTNGFQFKGIVKGFDSFTVVLESDNKQNLVYKHAISTIVPSRLIHIFDSGEGTGQEQENGGNGT
jgi:host factor-I protein